MKLQSNISRVIVFGHLLLVLISCESKSIRNVKAANVIEENTSSVAVVADTHYDELPINGNYTADALQQMDRSLALSPFTIGYVAWKSGGGGICPLSKATVTISCANGGSVSLWYPISTYGGVESCYTSGNNLQCVSKAFDGFAAVAVRCNSANSIVASLPKTTISRCNRAAAYQQAIQKLRLANYCPIPNRPGYMGPVYSSACDAGSKDWLEPSVSTCMQFGGFCQTTSSTTCSVTIDSVKISSSRKDCIYYG